VLASVVALFSVSSTYVGDALASFRLFKVSRKVRETSFDIYWIGSFDYYLHNDCKQFAAVAVVWWIVSINFNLFFNHRPPAHNY